MVVSVQEAQERLEELCDAAVAGDDVVISRDRVQVARLVAIDDAKSDGAFSL